MKILLINSEYPPVGGGAGNASAHVAQALAHLGCDVVILTTGFGSLPQEETQGAVRVLRLAGRRRRAERSGAAEQGMFMLSGAWAGARLVRRWRPDTVLAFFGVPGGAVALFLRIAFGVPYLVSLRGGDVPGFRPYDFARYHRLIRPLVRTVWRRAAAVVANSEGLRRLAGESDPTLPMAVIPNGVDLDRFAVAERDWRPARMLFVGRLVYQKGLDLVLQSLSALSGSPWQLTIVGDGPLRATLEAEVEVLGLRERVRFVGWMRGDDLLECYREATLFVFPSRHEGMPNAVLEAMAAGLPVVASAIAGNEELVIQGETGLLVAAEDVGALREALAALLVDPERRRSMGAAARRRVERHYTWDRTAASYLTLLRRAAGEA